MKKLRLIVLGAVIGCASNAFAAMPLPMGYYIEGNLGKYNESNAVYGNNVRWHVVRS